ncbi:hypothetical protein HUS23_01725 [Ectothiorhodospiraceae bacterium 2226]|nr:hypothetical protein HUS23_01725 [Ectothiorhodospiraceae bacterium 2226]
MGRSHIGTDWAIALAAGYLATKVTEQAQVLLWRATPPSARAREPRLPEGSSARQAARLVCDAAGIEPRPERLGFMKRCIHYGLGLGWGSVYGFLRRRSRMRPLGAGIVAGASMSLIVDETLNPALGITPPSEAYPASAHLRGFASHLVYGLALAGAAEGLHWLVERAGRRAARAS